MLELVQLCHTCGLTARLELVPPGRMAERRQRQLAERLKRCPVCKSRDVEIISRPIREGGGAA
ncbi:hypothetical protein [Caldinitratiruptor microaerophilus]|uniref:Uncharacterized protein n=1 Tax=Caldinitratiruptor microaerophilus TaxID=671077 RepID=A0AA35CK75_9FIRM|nr:hypothetical protein [Caldinitratiruptor microaerophilus]BDG59918.1 hypothetical protein caldi_10080 [Caldinitratiruptor microaerophilus]